tara:strand:- start:4359 stop:5339 length:981 start_codon:yes stop_codon:yes gene_type:complete
MEYDEQGNEDLSSRLHAMETKLSRLRNNRDTHNESAKRSADSRNSVQEQAVELRKKISNLMEEQKQIRDKAKIHQTRRDAIQKQIRDFISQKRGRRDDGPGKSILIQLSETVSEIERIEDQIMTDGRLSLEKENKLLKKLKSLISRKDELLPAVEEFQLIKVDLGDLEQSIQKLKSESDEEHNLMIEKHKEADEIWSNIKPMLEERDFLRGEGDRLHESFIEHRKKADEIHSTVVEMLSKVNEIREAIKIQNEERKQLIIDHNKSVRDALRTPDEDEELADSLTKQLMNDGSVTLGVNPSTFQKSEKQISQKRKGRKIGTSRNKKR